MEVRSMCFLLVRAGSPRSPAIVLTNTRDLSGVAAEQTPAKGLDALPLRWDLAARYGQSRSHALKGMIASSCQPARHASHRFRQDARRTGFERLKVVGDAAQDVDDVRPG